MENQLPSVSVVVPAYNEEEMLPRCLASIKMQSYAGPIEILVVDNASTDSTGEVARKAGATVVDEHRRGYVNAVSAGFAAAQGAIIACTDADSIVPHDWVKNMVQTLSRDKVVAASGVFVFNDGAAWVRVLGLMFGWMNYHLAGANMAVWAWAYRKCGGFAPSVNQGADVELGLRLKSLGKLAINRSVVVATSARRFQMAFWTTIWRYYVNDLSLFIRRKPVYFDFPNYRWNFSASRAMVMPALKWAAVGCAVMVSLAAVENPQSQLLGRTFTHARSQMAVALSFDDGPSRCTGDILNILDQYQAKGTFFLIGANVKQHADVARRMVASGHEIGNHTYSHQFYDATWPQEVIGADLDKGQKAIEQASGVRPGLFRPPYGWRSPWMISAARRRGYRVVMWSLDSRDWQKQTADQVVAHVVKSLRPGTIILFHDGLGKGEPQQRRNLIEALPRVIEECQKRGYALVTIDQLLQNQAAPAAKTVASKRDRRPALMSSIHAAM
jgi:peptidoglycan-N-acetylglucosamine deacetylase